jgi:4-hydroxy 2-oxovalerate aldolase
VPYVEIGYLRPHRHGHDGDTAPSASCPPDYLDRLRERAGRTRLVVMAHAKDIEPEDFRFLRRHGVSMVRMPTHPDAVEGLTRYADAAHGEGLTYAVNLIRISELHERDILNAARKAAHDIGADVCYLADSNGSMFPDQITTLARRLRREVPISLGFHAHDSISLAFSNTLAAMREGFTYVDASLAGMGKGGGNLSLELIASYLRTRAGRALSIGPLAAAAAEVVGPWKGEWIVASSRSIVGGMLDLNLDTMSSIARDDPDGLFTIIDTPTGTAPGLPTLASP